MLIEDTDESVRAATVKSIAINTVYIYDTDKYAQVNNIFIYIFFLYIHKIVTSNKIFYYEIIFIFDSILYFFYK